MEHSTHHPGVVLPSEMHAYVLSFCDDPTLASSSRVSLAFLEFTGPLLYRDMTIRGNDQLDLLIRSEAVLPSIAPFVSFDQTCALEYILLDEPDGENIDVANPIAVAPISLDKFVFDTRDFKDRDGLGFRIWDLASSVDPRHVHILEQPNDWSRAPCWVDLIMDEDLPWTQIESMTFVNILSDANLMDVPALSERSPPVDLVFDLSGPEFEASEKDLQSLHDKAQSLWRCLKRQERNGSPVSGFGRVQIWVNDGEEHWFQESLKDLGCTSFEVRSKESVPPS